MCAKIFLPESKKTSEGTKKKKHKIKRGEGG